MATPPAALHVGVLPVQVPTEHSDAMSGLRQRPSHGIWPVAHAGGPEDGAGEGEGEGETDPGTEQFAGDWSGSFNLYGRIDGAPEDMEFGCEAELDAQIDEDGSLTGDGSCELIRDREAAVILSGNIDGTGQVSGLLIIDAGVEFIEANMGGEASDEDSIDASLDATIVLRGGPAEGETAVLSGELNLGR